MPHAFDMHHFQRLLVKLNPVILHDLGWRWAYLAVAAKHPDSSLDGFKLPIIVFPTNFP